MTRAVGFVIVLGLGVSAEAARAQTVDASAAVRCFEARTQLRRGLGSQSGVSNACVEGVLSAIAYLRRSADPAGVRAILDQLEVLATTGDDRYMRGLAAVDPGESYHRPLQRLAVQFMLGMGEEGELALRRLATSEDVQDDGIRAYVKSLVLRLDG